MAAATVLDVVARSRFGRVFASLPDRHRALAAIRQRRRNDRAWRPRRPACATACWRALRTRADRLRPRRAPRLAGIGRDCGLIAPPRNVGAGRFCYRRGCSSAARRKSCFVRCRAQWIQWCTNGYRARGRHVGHRTRRHPAVGCSATTRTRSAVPGHDGTVRRRHMERATVDTPTHS